MGRGGGPRGWANGSFSLSINTEASSWVQPQQDRHPAIRSEPRLIFSSTPGGGG